MATKIEHPTMSEGINRAIDAGMHSHQSTGWGQILDTILSEHRNADDHFIIIIQGQEIVFGQPQFVNQMRLTMGQLREMAKE